MEKGNHIVFKRIGGVATLVTIAVGLTFIALMLIFLIQSINTAQDYTEEEAGYTAAAISGRLNSFLEEQAALVASGITDIEIESALADEAAGVPSAAVQNRLAPLLRQLTVDANAGAVFLESVGSHAVYTSEGVADGLSSGDALAALGAAGETISSGHVPAAEGLSLSVVLLKDGSAVVWRPLTLAGRTAGTLGVHITADAMEGVLAGSLVQSADSALLFDRDGAELLGTAEDTNAGENVFERYPQLADVQSQLEPNPGGEWRTWAGLNELLPRDQMLYELRYLETFDAYLLVMSTGQSIFNDMRSRSTTLLLVLGVVMLLLLLLLVSGVTWYRRKIIQATATDELTGLANRKSFILHFQRLVQLEDLGPVSLVLIDVDYFKQVNDTYGHAAGDKALAAIAQQVREITADGGLAGRWGGDEFIAVLRADVDEASTRVEDMMARVRALQLECGAQLSVSVGMTGFEGGGELQTLVDQADDALYATKEGGRGFLTVYEPGETPHMAADVPERIRQSSPVAKRAGDMGARAVQTGAGEGAARKGTPAPAGSIWGLLVKSLLNAVSKMIPFVAGGGILIAIAFLIDGASVDMNALSPEMRANFGSITPFAAGLRDVGSAAFGFMLPIFAAFFARGLAGNHAFMAGFAGGYLASQGSAGFAGAILAALVAAAVVRLLGTFLDETVPLIRRIAPVIIYPVLSLLVMYLTMTFIIEPFASVFDAVLTGMLAALLPGDRTLLGAVCGAMMATDMGGPINKAAYHFGTASIAAGSPEIMAAVMVGGMVPPCGIALCMLLFRKRFTEGEYDLAPSTFIMGLAFITEGALPFVLTDFLRVIPSCMVGSALAGALSMVFGCTLMAPHGGIFVFPVVGSPLLYVVALAAGSLLCALVLGLLKSVGASRAHKD